MDGVGNTAFGGAFQPCNVRIFENCTERDDESFEKKRTDMIEYGIRRGEFHDIPVKEMVDVIVYTDQGIRMWSRIVTLTPDTYKFIAEHI